MLTLLVTMAGGSYLLYTVTVSMMKVEAEERYQAIMSVTNEKVGSVLTSVEVAALNFQPALENSLDNPDVVGELLKRILENNPHLIGIGMGFEPDYFPEKGRWFELYVTRGDDGQVNCSQIGSQDHDYLSAEWYVNGRDAQEGRWSQPYFDNAGANNALLTYTLPLRTPEGKTVAVVGADISLEWLVARLREIDLQNNDNPWVIDPNDKEYASYSFIISETGTFLAHPYQELILDANYRTYAETTPDTLDNYLCQQMIKGRQGILKMTVDSIPSFVFYSPLEHARWSMAIVVPRISVLFQGFVFAAIIQVLVLFGMLLILFVCRIVIRRATKPLTRFAESADEVAKGNFNTPMPEVRRHDELFTLRESFGKMQTSLAQYIEQLKTTTTQRASLEKELKIAHDIQMAMLPKKFPPYPDHPEIDLYGQLTPAKAVGGDLFDFFIRDDKLFFCIGDVSGKGVPAALVMAVTKALFRNVSVHQSSPEQILSEMNTSMAEGNETNMFVTLFIGVLDLKTGTLLYANAGHDAPLMMPADGENALLPCDANIPVGVMAGWPYTLQQTPMPRQVIIFLYTDGLTEAEDIDHAQFGINRILEVARAAFHHPQLLIESMTKAVHQFVGGAEQSDDLTMLAIRYH